MLEENLKRALLLEHGDPVAMASRPITAVLLSIAVILILIQIVPVVQRFRRDALAE
jgi:TctA family transporter